MKINIVGKVRRTGVSKKSGQGYDFIEIHFLAPARGVEGEAAHTVTIDPAIIPYDKIMRGAYYIDFDQRGTPLALAPIQESPVK